MTAYALQKSRVVVASAGTGKTHALVETYVGLLQGLGREPLRPSEILALTFTERAAGEMRDRVTLRLRTLGADDASLLRLEPQVLGAPICTFHAFCVRVLGEFGATCGLPLHGEVMDAAVARQLLQESALRAVAECVAGAARAEVMELVAEMGLSTQVGLLSAVVGLLQSLGERGLQAEQLSLVRTPEDGFARARAVIPSLVDEATAMGTTAAARARINTLRALSQHLAACAEVDDALPHLAAIHEQASGNWGGASMTHVRGRLKDAAADGVSTWAARQATRAAGQFKGLLARAELAYRARKEDEGRWDFNDLLAATRDLLRAHPDVRTRLQARHRAVLVDEMQDTSPLQAELLALLLDSRETAPAGLRDARIDDGRLLIVGDRKQSIYGFRGADVALFEDARAAVRAGGGEEQVLRESRRSSATLVPLLNRFARAALGDAWAPDDELATVRTDGLTPAVHRVRVTLTRTGEGAGATHPLASGVPSSSTNGVAQPPPAVLVTAAEARAREAVALAHHVASLLRGPGAIDGVQPADIAVLLRKRAHAEQYRCALEAAGVPARVGRGGDLLARPEVTDAAALLSVLADPGDAHALAVVLRSPWVMLSDDTLVSLSPAPDGLVPARVLADALDPAAESRMTSEERAALWKLRRVVEQLSPRAGAMDAGDALGVLLEALDGWAVLELHDDGAARCANLRALELLVRGRTVAEAARFLVEAHRSAVSFPLGMAELDGAQVPILTVHEAKGLEWRVVVLADLASGAGGPPSGAAWHPRAGLAVRIADDPYGAVRQTHAVTAMRAVQVEQERDADEETRRLLYVALTRARDVLVFSGETGTRGADADTFLARLSGELDRATAEGMVRLVLDPLMPPRPPVRVSATATELQASLFNTHGDVTAVPDLDAHAALKTGNSPPLRWHAPWRVPRSRWGRPTDDDVRRALAGETDEAALRAVHASEIVRALATVPRTHLWVDVPVRLRLSDATVPGRVGVVAEGVDGGAWTVVDLVFGGDAPAALERLRLCAAAVSADAGGAPVNGVLGTVRDGGVVFSACAWSTGELRPVYDVSAPDRQGRRSYE